MPAGIELSCISAEPGFIEGDVVRGFLLKASKSHKKSVVVHYPTGQVGPEGFPEYAKDKEMFEPHQYATDSWENAFYRSLSDADGVILLGGGYSTLITGLVALAYRVPLVTLSRYGGSAQAVWTAIKRGQDLPPEEDIQNMAGQATPKIVEAWIRSLETQFEVRQKEKNEQQSSWPAVVTLLLLAAWVILLPLGYWLRPPNTNQNVSVPLVFIVLLFVAPMLSGASGATVRSLLPDGGNTNLRSAVKGTAAGVISALLYLVAQLITNPAPSFLVLVFTLIFGFIAGFTFDRVFKKLESIDTLHADVLAESGKRGGFDRKGKS